LYEKITSSEKIINDQISSLIGMIPATVAGILPISPESELTGFRQRWSESGNLCRKQTILADLDQASLKPIILTRSQPC
jgi:hypothetical protein